MSVDISHCRICHNASLTPILSLGNQHLTGVFPKTSTETISAGPLELLKCTGENVCGLVQLGQSYDSSELYGADYGYRSGLNSSMVAHLRQKVATVQARVGELTSNDIVLDVGSNDGTLLGFYPEHVCRVGMDPTARKFQQYYAPGIQVIPDFFSASQFHRHFGDRRAKVVTSIAMFYDLESPVKFAQEIASILDDNGIWHFEQSYLPAMLDHNAYDTICHEHLEYYGLKQVNWIIDRCGLKIVDVELNDVNGGSFAVTVAKSTSKIKINSEAVRQVLDDEDRRGLDEMGPYQQFRDRVFQHRDKLRSTLDLLRNQGANVLGYGASTKGNVILQFCGLTAAEIPCIAEVNPDKFGHFTPGTGIPIVSEAAAHAMNPDYLLVLPWHFKENLVRREAAFLERGGKMIFPLPDIQIVSR